MSGTINRVGVGVAEVWPIYVRYVLLCRGLGEPREWHVAVAAEDIRQ